MIDPERHSDLITDHEEYIHDIAFDFYGKRVATCSSDLTIKIFDLQEEERKWKRTATIKAHEGPVWKVQWADPCYGNLIASISEDKTIKFFEEKEVSTIYSLSSKEVQK